MYHKTISICVVLIAAFIFVAQPNKAQDSSFFSTSQTSTQKPQIAKSNVTTHKNTLLAYSGSMLPSDWMLLSVLNDRAIIGFTNGSSRNARIEELDTGDKAFVEKLQNGTLTGPALRDRLAQWSSTVTTKVTQFGKSLKDQVGNIINNFNTNNTMSTTTSPIAVN